MFLITYFFVITLMTGILAYFFLHENIYKQFINNPKMDLHKNELKSTRSKAEKIKSYVKYLSDKTGKKAHLLILPTNRNTACCYKNIIIIDRGLIASLSLKHLYSVVAHEFGHVLYNVSFFRFIVSSSFFIAASTLIYCLTESRHAIFDSMDWLLVGITLLVCFTGSLDLDLHYVKMSSKKREFCADEYAASVIDPFLLIESIDRLRTIYDPPIDIPSGNHPSDLDRFRKLSSYIQKKGKLPD